MPETTVILNAAAIQRALTRVAHEITERNEVSGDVVLVGIQRGGVALAERLAGILAGIVGHAVPSGALDVSTLAAGTYVLMVESAAGQGLARARFIRE